LIDFDVPIRFRVTLVWQKGERPPDTATNPDESRNSVKSESDFYDQERTRVPKNVYIAQDDALLGINPSSCVALRTAPSIDNRAAAHPAAEQNRGRPLSAKRIIAGQSDLAARRLDRSKARA